MAIPTLCPMIGQLTPRDQRGQQYADVRSSRPCEILQRAYTRAMRPLSRLRKYQIDNFHTFVQHQSRRTTRNSRELVLRVV